MNDTVGALRQAGEMIRAAMTTRNPTSPVPVDAAELVSALTATQELINTLSGVQVGLIAQIAHTQGEWDDDDVSQRWGMEPRLDTAALIAGPLMMGAQGAGRRAEEAVWLARIGEPLLAAMVEGVIDRRRAELIVDELDGVQDRVARVVVEQVTGQVRDGLLEDRSSQAGVRLRRQVHGVLAQVDPAGARAKVSEGLSRRSLRRWVEGPGSDGWKAVLPAAESAQAWAAVDDLARRFVATGQAPTLEQARALAMVALVTGNATASYHVRLVVPWPGSHPTNADTFDQPGNPDQFGHPDAGWSPDNPSYATPAPRLTLAQMVARLSRVDPTTGIEVAGLGNPHPTVVPVGFVTEVLTKAAAAGRVVLSWSDPGTGALIDPDGRLSRDGYRPSERLTELVKARDGRCRFPGCLIPVRFCDLDHVRPWPTGPTAVSNLMWLCRRHHRVKHLRGWRVSLAPDGTATWVNPVGAVTITHAINHHATTSPTATPAITPGDSTPADRAGTPPGSGPCTSTNGERHRPPNRDEQPFSVTEHALEHVLAAHALTAELTRRHIINHRHGPNRLVTTETAAVRHLGFRGRWDADHHLKHTGQDGLVDLIPSPPLTVTIPHRERHDPPPF